jgi:hypothetical protein
MLELEEAGDAGSVHIIGHGRATKRDGFLEDGLQAGMQAVKFGPLQVASHPAGPDSGPEQTLVGIDVPHAVQELLIEQSGLDRSAAEPKKSSKLVS